MKITNYRTWWLSFFALLAGSAPTKGHAAPQLSKSATPLASSATVKLNPDVARVLSWLPSNTESLIVAQGPFVTPPSARDENRPSLEPPLFWTLGGLLAPPYEPVLRGRTIMAAVEGSRNFRAPSGLGLMPFDGCCVLLLKPDGRFQTVESMRKAVKGAQRQRVMDYPGLVITQKSENDYWRSYAVMPRPDVLLIASNSAYLSEVLTAMRRPVSLQATTAKSHALTQHAFPSTLPLWKQVDTAQPFWGLRWYGANPKRSPSGGDIVNDPQAIGWTFSANTKNPQQVKVRYFSPNPQGIAQVRRIWDNPAEGSTPRITAPLPGLLEINSNLRDPRSKSITFFYLLGIMGHAIFV